MLLIERKLCAGSGCSAHLSPGPHEQARGEPQEFTNEPSIYKRIKPLPFLESPRTQHLVEKKPHRPLTRHSYERKPVTLKGGAQKADGDREIWAVTASAEHRHHRNLIHHAKESRLDGRL